VFGYNERILIKFGAWFDFQVAKLDTASDLPYRMTVHPAGRGLICAFSESCRSFYST
jgi:hypothetical protein